MHYLTKERSMMKLQLAPSNSTKSKTVIYCAQHIHTRARTTTHTISTNNDHLKQISANSEFKYIGQYEMHQISSQNFLEVSYAEVDFCHWLHKLLHSDIFRTNSYLTSKFLWYIFAEWIYDKLRLNEYC